MKKILVVDDEIDVVEVVEMLLELEGYKVLKAYDGKEALAAVEKETEPKSALLFKITFPAFPMSR